MPAGRLTLATPSLVLPELPLNVPVKTFGDVCLLIQGATIRRDEATGAVIVARIMRGGAADRSGETKPSPSTLCHNLCLISLSNVGFQQNDFFLFYLCGSTDRKVRRLRCITLWTVGDQILEIRAARLHILRLKTRDAPDSLPWRWLDSTGKFLYLVHLMCLCRFLSITSVQIVLRVCVVCLSRAGACWRWASRG